jgi:hypothetical protein
MLPNSGCAGARTPETLRSTVCRRARPVNLVVGGTRAERMGQYFHIVNPAKRQYISASTSAENNKDSGVMLGYHAIAVALLVCNLDQVSYERGEPRHSYGPLAGSWFGDRVYLAGDDHGEPDEFGIKTSSVENPGRNLYWIAEEEFDDISYRAIAMLCEGQRTYAEELATKAAKPSHSKLLMHLGNVVFQVGCNPLEGALEHSLGRDWTRKYKRA